MSIHFHMQCKHVQWFTYILWCTKKMTSEVLTSSNWAPDAYIVSVLVHGQVYMYVVYSGMTWWIVKLCMFSHPSRSYPEEYPMICCYVRLNKISTGCVTYLFKTSSGRVKATSSMVNISITYKVLSKHGIAALRNHQSSYCIWMHLVFLKLFACLS